MCLSCFDRRVFIFVMDESKSTSLARPFNGTNIETWTFQMELLLQKERLYEHVSTNPLATRNRNADWLAADANAMHIIGKNVDDEHLGTIQGCQTVHAMFMALKRLFETELSIYVMKYMECRIPLVQK